MADNFLIYGSYGYTGALMAREAVARGMRPILAGRNAERLAAQAADLGLEYRAFGLRDKEAMEAALADVSLVAHCAGPFQRTCLPMLKACIRAKVHYIDITGEVDVFELCAASDKRARDAGVMIMPGAGFDVVPSDCLAAHLKRRLPDATLLELAFASSGKPSHGTKMTLVENIARGLVVREDGKLARKPAGWKTRSIDFGRGPRKAITIPWGDVSTAFRSTGIPNIRVYTAAPLNLRAFLKASRWLGPVLGSGPVQRYLKRKIDTAPPGPSDEERARNSCTLWGEAVDDAGNRATARLRTPDGYTLTVLTALAVVEKVLGGNAPTGYQTPATAYGPDFILEIDGCAREDLD